MANSLGRSQVLGAGWRRAVGVSALAAALAVPGALAAGEDSADGAAEGVEADRVRHYRLDLDSLTIPEAQRRMERGSLSSVGLTEAYLDRLLRLDPLVNSIIDIDHHVLAAARASDQRRRQEGPRSALEGIPVLLKDNIDAEGFATTAGSRALLSTRPDDAELTARLRAAGAIILGKTNLSEWANFRGLQATSGWSGVGGQTNNPYVLDRNPCGSSSGSAAAAAAALAQVTIGTETDGSIVCPSGQTGVVGLKPTLGLVSRDGVVPLSAEQDTAGPIARHVVDVAVATAVIQGTDERDPATSEIPESQPQDYLALLDDDSLEGARLGLWRPYALGEAQGADEEQMQAVEEVFQSARTSLEKAGAEVVEVSLPYQDQINEAEFPLLISEFARDLPTYLDSTPGEHPRTIQGLIDFDLADPVELSLFDQGIFELAAKEPRTPTSETVALREETRRLARASIDEVLQADDLDAIVAPTNSAAWRTTYANTDGMADAFLFGSSGPAAVAGYPNITVPAGYVGKLPIGLSFFGTRWDEEDLMSYAYDFESDTDARVRPRFIPTIDR